MQSNNQKLIVAGAAASLILAAGYYIATKKQITAEKTLTIEPVSTSFTDSEKGTLHYLTKQEAL